MEGEFIRQVECAARSVRSAYPGMPRREKLVRELDDAMAAQARGHFLPDEDERLRQVYVRYLSARAVLLDAIQSIEPMLTAAEGEMAKFDVDSNAEIEPLEEAAAEFTGDWQNRLRAFVVGFTSAAILVRSSSYLVDLAEGRPVVWKKLDEPEPRFGIERKSFTQVFKNLSSATRMWRFHEAMGFYEVHREDIAQLGNDPVVGQLVDVLQGEEDSLRYRKRDFLKRHLKYRLYSFKRRHLSGFRKVMFHLFQLSGTAIAELRQPFSKSANEAGGKRVTDEIREALRPHLEAGDIFITRHHDALSNWFLPGFWPHAALYIGTPAERSALGLPDLEQESRSFPETIAFLEAKKDGVLFRPMEETLQVDAFLVLRPRLETFIIREALARAISHQGKLYDFLFDFRDADRLACTELIYRSYHAAGPVSFTLQSNAGRPSISAEDLIEQALGSGHFEKVIAFGEGGDHLSVCGTKSEEEPLS